MSYIEKRNFSEVLAICRLEPKMRNIIVEGITDKLVVERFLKKEHKTGISIINVDMICFDDEYKEVYHHYSVPRGCNLNCVKACS